MISKKNHERKVAAAFERGVLEGQERIHIPGMCAKAYKSGLEEGTKASRRSYEIGYEAGREIGGREAEMMLGRRALASLATIVVHGSVLQKGVKNPGDLDILHSKPGGDEGNVIFKWRDRNRISLPIDARECISHGEEGPFIPVPSPWGTEAPFIYLHEGDIPAQRWQIDRLSSAIRGDAINEGAFADWLDHTRSKGSKVIIQLREYNALRSWQTKIAGEYQEVEHPQDFGDVETLEHILKTTPEGSFDTLRTLTKALKKHVNGGELLEQLPGGGVLIDVIENYRGTDSPIAENPTHLVLNFGSSGAEYDLRTIEHTNDSDIGLTIPKRNFDRRFR